MKYYFNKILVYVGKRIVTRGAIGSGREIMIGLGQRKWVIMVMLTVLHIVGILMFTRGFLLTRTELPYYSNSSDVFHSPCFDHSQSNDTCWTRPAVNRLVIIVLDALRCFFSLFLLFFFYSI